MGRYRDWVRRHRGLAAFAAGVLVTLAALAVVVYMVLLDQRRSARVLAVTPGMRDRLSAMGLMHEIIAWKLRFFVPVSANGPVILGRVMARHPLTGLADRAAA